MARFWGNARRRRKEGQEFRSLEVRGKLIALKNWVLVFSFMYWVSVDLMGRSYTYRISSYSFLP